MRCSFFSCFWLQLLLVTLCRGQLGPDDDWEHCYSGDCGHGDNTEDELEIENLEIEEEGELADRGETRPSLFSRFTNLASNTAKAVYNTVYKLSSEVLDDIARIVKTVLNETVYGIFAETGEGILDTIYDPDKLFGKALHGIGKATLSLSILAACLVLSYILSSYLSLLTILAFDAAILLIHYMFGPVFIGKHFLNICAYSYAVGVILLHHPYWFSGSIVLLFLCSLAWPFIRRRYRNLRTTDDRVVDIDMRLERIETQQKDMMDLLKKVLKKLEESSSNHEE